MIAAGAVEVQGIDRCLRMFDKGDQEFIKALKKASRAGANAVKRQMKHQLPERFRSLCKAKVKSDRDGQIWAMIGEFNLKETSGRQPKSGTVYDWFKAYWKNYGTLKHRDAGHTYRTKVKKMNGRRNNEGQEAEHFFEAASDGWENIYYTQMKSSLEKTGYKLDR